jgi:hypothetical protein
MVFQRAGAILSDDGRRYHGRERGGPWLDLAADTGGDVVTEAYRRSDNGALRLSKDEARLVTLIRDKDIDPSTIIAKIQEAE